MPSVHIWIKKDDWDKWQAIADKPEWLHEHLNADLAMKLLIENQRLDYFKEHPEEAPIMTGLDFLTKSDLKEEPLKSKTLQPPFDISNIPTKPVYYNPKTHSFEDRTEEPFEDAA